jgi:hypothetical protein
MLSPHASPLWAGIGWHRIVEEHLQRKRGRKSCFNETKWEINMVPQYDSFIKYP